MEQLKHQHHGFEDMKTGIHAAFNFTVPETVKLSIVYHYSNYFTI